MKKFHLRFFGFHHFSDPSRIAGLLRARVLSQMLLPSLPIICPEGGGLVGLLTARVQ
jgi:hypothetical protein